MEYPIYIHEIKNPLNAIYGASQLISTCQTSEVKTYIDIILQSVDNIKKIEKDFNEYCKSGCIAIQYDMVNLKLLLKEVITEHRALLKKYHVEVVLNCGETNVITDHMKLKQVLINIISNAVKYNKKNGVVNISCYSENSDIIIHVKDTGIGISPTELNRIYKPFYRSKKIDRPGTGLGVCIINKIANLLKWKFTIMSVENIGTTVEIIIHHDK
jgi:signal transduction histidine kinase